MSNFTVSAAARVTLGGAPVQHRYDATIAREMLAAARSKAT